MSEPDALETEHPIPPAAGAPRTESSGALTADRPTRIRRHRRRPHPAGEGGGQRPRPEPQALAEAPVGSAPHDKVRRRLLAAADVLAAGAAFVLVVTVLGHDSLGLGAAVAIAMVVAVCKVAGLYDRDEHLLHKTTLDEAPAIFRVAGLYTLLTFLAGAAIVDGSLGRGQAVVLWVTLGAAMLLMRAGARRLSGRLLDEERCLIVGGAGAAERLAAQLGRCAGTRVQIVGRVPIGGGAAAAGSVPVLGSFGALEQLLAAHRIDRAVIAPSPEDGDGQLLDAIRVVKRLGVRISVLPGLLEAVGSAYVLDEIEGSTLLGLRRHGLSRSSRLLKRAFDLVLASLLLVLLAPLMVMIAVAIKLDSAGPVLFRQRRVGLGDSVFRIYKFRTMIDGAEAQRAALAHRNEAGGGLFKIEGDPRITRVGGFLRRTSLDELAQLLNVLRGEMSLVGPRPLILAEDELIEGLHRHRLLVPPGVTGLWQIFGSARIPLDEMVKIDYLYGANWSLWLDTKILLRTVPFVLSRRGL
ncbi:MAG TPA: sugar transferase [Solirubrobacterales bacterium]|nr:sugar transferase [Solirubrobacterales bacterium]